MMIYGDCGEQIAVTNSDLKFMIGNQFGGTTVPDIFFELALQFKSSFYSREIGDPSFDVIE